MPNTPDHIGCALLFALKRTTGRFFLLVGSEHRRIQSYVRDVAKTFAQTMSRFGALVAFSECHLLQPLPIIGLGENHHDHMRAPSEERLNFLRSITGPNHPGLIKHLEQFGPDDARTRQEAYNFLQEQLWALNYLKWEDNDSPFEDEHWVLAGYGSIGIHLNGTIPASQFEAILKGATNCK